MIREAGQWKRGYLKLKIWGYGVERFLNVCGKTGDLGRPGRENLLRSRMFLLHGTERFPQNPPGCPENQSPHPDTEAAGPAIFPSQEPETMDFVCGPLTERNDFDGIIHVFMERDL